MAVPRLFIQCKRRLYTAAGRRAFIMCDPFCKSGRVAESLPRHSHRIVPTSPMPAEPQGEPVRVEIAAWPDGAGAPASFDGAMTTTPPAAVTQDLDRLSGALDSAAKETLEDDADVAANGSTPGIVEHAAARCNAPPAQPPRN